ncbi:MAG TPA: pyridoxamine 5'-phosphate oxidase [Polyangiaceae bacterium]|jgi:pyridoxamine 5'-phosphate oxidase|nr:pyridoxamine 5'-phosphate oxidase [Polyangiaceae bacterium]
MTTNPPAGSDPLESLAYWIDEARRRGVADPDAMALATSTPDGAPSVRVVFCRGVDAQGLRFFTNYESRKGREIAANPRAAATFFWPLLDRQVRVEGRVEKLPGADSDEYFHHRPRGHQLGAWASQQSQPLVSLDALRAESDRLAALHEGEDVPRPPHWGGYLLRPSAVELWIRGRDRLHDRVRYDRVESANGWVGTRLNP